jgi:hypothetical protein
MQFNQPPTNDTFNRASAYPNFTLHTGSPWEKLQQEGDQVRIVTPQGDQGLFDFLIVSTGLLTDARLRPELASMADQIATWEDKFTPGPQQRRNALIDAHPYLGEFFEFQEKVSRHKIMLVKCGNQSGGMGVSQGSVGISVSAPIMILLRS